MVFHLCRFFMSLSAATRVSFSAAVRGVPAPTAVAWVPLLIAAISRRATSVRRVPRVFCWGVSSSSCCPRSATISAALSLRALWLPERYWLFFAFTRLVCQTSYLWTIILTSWFQIYWNMALFIFYSEILMMNKSQVKNITKKKILIIICKKTKVLK